MAKAKDIKHKRLKFAIWTLVGNFLIFLYAIYKGVEDLQGLGLGMAAINIPLLSFIVGDSIRPSGHQAGKPLKGYHEENVDL